MSTTKRILGDYEIQTIDSDGNPAGEVTVTSETFRVKGDLVVTGETTSVSETNLSISNNTILVNEGETGAGVTAGEAGLIVDRGTESDAVLRWNETTDSWEIGLDGGSFSSLGGLQNVVEDITPQLGGNLDVNSQSIISTSNGDIVLAPDGTGSVTHDAPTKLINQPSTPSSTAGYNTLYAQTPAAGGTGLFVNNSTVNDELVSKSKAIVYGIIF